MNTATRFTVMCLLLISTAAPERAWSQGSKKAPVQSIPALDKQAEKAQNEYLVNLADLANKYQDAGDVQKSMDMLKTILKIKPDADNIKSKLKEIEEAAFNDNVITVEVDSATGWSPTGLLLSKDKPIRLEAEGTYKFAANDILTPAGYATKDLARDMADGVPCGGLMALVGKSATAPAAGTRNPRQNQQRDTPHIVYIGTQKEFTPQDDGPLLLRLNVPESAKCTGKIKVKISGHFLSSR